MQVAKTDVKRSGSAQEDKHLEYKLRKCSLSITIAILAVLVALLVGIIRGGDCLLRITLSYKQRLAK